MEVSLLKWLRDVLLFTNVALMRLRESHCTLSSESSSLSPSFGETAKELIATKNSIDKNNNILFILVTIPMYFLADLLVDVQTPPLLFQDNKRLLGSYKL